MLVPGQRLGQYIGDVLLGGHMVEGDDTVRDAISYEVMLDVDVLGPSMVVIILGQVDAARVVAPHGRRSGCVVEWFPQT